MEAESDVAYTAKRDLIAALKLQFPRVQLPPDDSDHWLVEPSSEILSAAKVRHTDESV